MSQSRIFRFFIRTSAFMIKEVVNVLRQPRLVLTLVIGPFLIMLIFGLGYSNDPRTLQTIFVLEPNSSLRAQVEKFAGELGSSIQLAGITSDREAAFEQLAQNKVDLVVAVPPDAASLLLDSKQAVFNLYHNEVDPMQAGYVEFVGRLYTDELNRRVLLSITESSQEQAATLQKSLISALERISHIRQSLEKNDLESARSEAVALENDLNDIQDMLGSLLSLSQSVRAGLDVDISNPILDVLRSSEFEAAMSMIDDLNRQVASLEQTGFDVQSAIGQVNDMQDRLGNLEETIAEFRSIRPYVLVNPFRSDASQLNDLEFSTTDFFAPAVIVLLLQHLAVTFASQSIVKERRSGAIELFRVAPISPLETLLGKYLSYLGFTALLAGLITVLIVPILKIPMLGSWPAYALVLLVTLYTALGAGFLISLVSQTDTQAVQYAMLLLLASVFFSGFFLDLRQMVEQARLVSWALPATYGIKLLQNVMLRGLPAVRTLLIGLGGMGIGLFLVNWLGLEFLMRRE